MSLIDHRQSFFYIQYTNLRNVEICTPELYPELSALRERSGKIQHSKIWKEQSITYI